MGKTLADRILPHHILNDIGREFHFRGVGGGSRERPTDVADRAAHARLLTAALDRIEQREGSSGTYLDVLGRPGEAFFYESLNKSGLQLLRVEEAEPEMGRPGRATVFASSHAGGLEKLEGKIEKFAGEMRRANRNGVQRPHHADLVQSIGDIAQASLAELWRHPTKPFPQAVGEIAWEVWLSPADADRFIETAVGNGVHVYPDRIRFPEDVVVLARATTANLGELVLSTGAVRSLGAPAVPLDFVDTMAPEDQAAWLAELLDRTQFVAGQQPAYVSLLDTGVSRAHPLIQPALAAADRHAADPAWGVEDVQGHGTRLAGLALFGDLRPALESADDISIRHRLESAKVIPDAGGNPHHLLGAVTRQGIDWIEATGDRRRVFTLATTTSDDTPHSGAPTSWSAEIDQLAAGASGNVQQARLLVVSAGNLDFSRDAVPDYLSVCDHEDAEVESPSQAWNAICVGAMTERDGAGGATAGLTLAAAGDLSPSSRTASWAGTWPIKPDIVMEGGNWWDDGSGWPNTHGDLMAVTTSRSYPVPSFAHCADTSAATALAARDLALLRDEYLDLWPETIRALYVSSARWTEQMRSHLPGPAKGDYERLFRRYGYGVPSIERARRTASNAVSLVVQDQIRPYTADGKLAPMKVFALPWPVEALRALGAAQVTLRVCLSTFIEPNPSETARGRKLRYASHGLRFKLKRADENDAEFASRVGREARTEDFIPIGGDATDWTYGSQRRDVGSIHIDTMRRPASDLARRGHIAVHAVGGWWIDTGKNGEHDLPARFALVVEIDAGEMEVELYAEVQAAVAAMNAIEA